MITDNLQISVKEIDEQNKDNWNLRYKNPREVIKLSDQLLLRTQEISYLKGSYLAKLNRLVCEFLLSEHNEEIITELYEIIQFFKTIEPESGYVHALNLTANIFQSYGDYPKGIELCKIAQKIAKELGDETDLADNYSVCGLIYSDLSDYENAIDNFKKALDLRIKKDDKKAIASSLNLIARTYSLSENYNEALIYYNKALSIREEMKDVGGLPWTHIGLASTYEKTKDHNIAVKHYETALNLNRELNDKRCNLHCYLGLGSVKSIINPSKIAEGYLLEAKKIAEELNSKPMLYKIYKNLSDLHEKMDEIPEAFEYYKLYHSIKEEVINTKLQNTIKNQEIVFAIEKSQKETEIYRLKHIELKSAYEQVESKNKEITDSINYAKNIQIALLPGGDYIHEILPERFIFFKPRDIVSGDFYWINKVENKIIVVAADCTGHGVPGAFMSMLGISFLNEIVNKNMITQPDLILNELRNMVISSLNRSDKEVKDGMDIALTTIDTDTYELEFAGAYNPLLLIRQIPGTEEPELVEIKADRMPIGKYLEETEPFTKHKYQLKKNDTIYMFSDGYVDQFGGEKNEKFKIRRFRKLLIAIQNKSMPEQKEILEKVFIKWQGDEDQLDDVIVIGLRF